MSAEQSLRDGDIDAALREVTEQVRNDPAESKYRIFLFQLLAVSGDWKRALNQLKVLKDMDPSTIPMVQTYSDAIQCEALRARVFEGQSAPLIFGEPEQWLALLLEALKRMAQNQHAEAATLREQALAMAPATSGTIDGQSFDWLADADPRFGPVLEAVVNGRYYWVPVHHIQCIQFEAPADLRDVVWMPAQFTWANGGEAVGLVPARYPGSEVADNALIRLGRKTDWDEITADTQLGLGQRLLATESADFPLFDIREIRFDASAAAERQPEPGSVAGSAADG